MYKKTRLKVSLVYILFITLFPFLIPHVSAHSLSPRVSIESLKKEQQPDSRRSEAQEINKEEPKKESEILLETPVYTQVELSSIVGEIFVNPRYTGRITTVRTFSKTGSPKDNPVVDARETDDGWEKLIVSQSESNSEALIATGWRGSLKISLSKREVAKSDKLQPLGDLIISFGELNATLLIPLSQISQPGSFEVDILNYKENKFIKGDIIAIRKGQVAVNFHDLPSTVVNGDGMVRISLKKPGGDSIGADLKAWGYNIFAPDIGTGKPAPITAEVFGLPKDVKLKFTFEPLPGQNITPSTKVLTVSRINLGEPLGTIITSIPGAQALSVSVERVE